MKFQLIDAILEQSPDRILAIKHITMAEEYLGDHFPGFPVFPGVLMVEALVQAGRAMLAARDPAHARLVLGEIKALKYGTMVRPGDALVVEVQLTKTLDDGSFACQGTGTVRREARLDRNTENDVAVSGRFTLRPIRLT